VAGACECGNELSGSVKCGEFLDLLRNCWLLRKGSAPKTRSRKTGRRRTGRRGTGRRGQGRGQGGGQGEGGHG